MAQKAPTKNRRELAPVLAFDLGGTKVAVGVVNSRGRILDEIRVPTVFQEGKDAVIRQLSELGQGFLDRYPRIKYVGVASAGPLDPAKGILLDPTNFSSREGKKWGTVPLAKLLSTRLKRKVFLENDAAAAVLAEHWIGAAKGYRNAIILTLGTGLGTGMICENELVRAGRGQHPEGGHVILDFNDSSAPCGCGNIGCAEAYLSGRSFTRRARVRLGREDLDAKAIADLARAGDPKFLELFDEYSRVMAVAIHNYVVLYAPEIVIFTGSFANTADLFLEKTRKQLLQLLARRRQGVDLLPKLALSRLENNAGLIGGALVALRGK
ncbi:MAG: hypothetical protein A2X94_16835 [Bdellovibrionales bacterium GWB1_55_8]|nr:MAG: hypothetical protein A2X94_16835 [Bdellovibrionales bacterium GWB1_55_8]